jgi:hypothetical protein
METIAARLGVSVDALRDDTPANSQVREKHDSVQDSHEMQRIRALPRRPAPSPDQPHMVELAQKLTQHLQRHPDPYPVGRQYGKANTGYLRPLQACGLHEGWRHGGLLGPIAAGYGKTLMAYLFPAVLGAKRPLYVAPASQEKGVEREFVRYSQHWRGPHPSNYPFVSYETLSSKKNGELRDSKKQLLRVEYLERMKPDLIVFDECHKLKNKDKAICVKRVKRYLQRNPDCRVVGLSGTMTRRSLKDFAHIALWCLPRTCPVPTTYHDLEAWASALDELDSLAPRTGFGALLQLCSEDEREAVKKAKGLWDEDEIVRGIMRRAVRNRLTETPGVVSTQDGPLGIPLEIVEYKPHSEDPAINEAFENVRALWQLPNGRPIADGLELARHAKTIGNGYWTSWDPPPPDEWLDARSKWAKRCREIITHNRMNLDGEAQVRDAVDAGIIVDHGELLKKWRDIAPSYDPEAHAVVEWISTEAVETARSWLADHKGIIWTDSLPLGHALSEALGLPFYAAEGKDANGKFILDHKPGEPFIASRQANGTGHNLQRGWHESLWFTAPEEQSLARQHRPGQEADKVSCYLHVGCWEHLAAFYKAHSKAVYAEQVTGNAQRLVYAEKTLPSLDDVESREGPRWSR